MRTLRQHRSDRGALSVFVALVCVGLLIAIGLIVDLGGRLRAVEQADGYAMEAARAGGEQIDAGQAMSGHGFAVDPVAASTAAKRYLAAAGVRGSVSVNAAGHRITVTTTYSYKTFFLAALGIGSFTVHGEGSAGLLYGVTQPENGPEKGNGN
ncbi:hypothetical protein BIV57_21525 [Mangrovactinospora gilvigrisea]|uniref:Uncharacterized protein n=1 Tax=Mangrovactinospora gilvigrisea TaxID=1428644 RepID=A0A1J7BPS5_9ACTN|nr:hypothetical protein [Mangrovactinospora gilvigrisea]OIV35449.1 hypothetical protein BIV57_21525 [Mangrovactinospora gilvigrisea]